MASKGKGKASQAQGDLQMIKKQTKQYEGALDNSKFVMCQMQSGEWHKSRIIDCRLAKDYDPKRQKIDSSYEYYIHYEDFNRRMDEWVPRNRIELSDEIIFEQPIPQKKKKIQEQKMENHVENDEHEGLDETSILQHNEVTKFQTIDSIEIGKYRCDTWYYSPLPQGYHDIECLYVCEFCLAFYISKSELTRHISKCPITHPPGNEIYRDDTREPSLSLFQVDGYRNSNYCENLCYLSKLFLDHKNLYYNMDPFLFFVLCQNDEFGSHIVGYFSKEKQSTQGWNLSCILTFPFQQRKGYGKFLISMSYEISLIQEQVGTPERPLSDLGKASYLSWWSQSIIQFIRSKPPDHPFTVKDIIDETGISEKDIIWTVEQTKMLQYAQGQMILCTDTAFLDQIYKEAGRPGVPIIQKFIHWVPFRYKWDKEQYQFKFPKYEFSLVSELKQNQKEQEQEKDQEKEKEQDKEKEKDK